MLDHVLAHLITAISSIQAAEDDMSVNEFKIQHHFAPAQKNEIQLRFVKTNKRGKKCTKEKFK